MDEEVVTSIQAIFRKIHQIEKVVLYGSRAKGNYKAGSDIDIDITLIGNGLTLAG